MAIVLRTHESHVLGRVFTSIRKRNDVIKLQMPCRRASLARFTYKTTLIVAHGGTIKCIEAYIRKFKLDSDWIGNVVKNCSLSYIEVDEHNEIKEIFYNDTKHLEGSAALN